jgi:alpha-2-macroglobulin
MKKLFTVLVFLTISCSVFAAENWSVLEQKADTEYKNNNWKDAFLLYKKVILEHRANPSSYSNAVYCLKKAQMEKEFDSFFDAVAKKYSKNPAMAITLAQSKRRVSRFGYIIAGKFERGYHRGGGQQVSCLERDRVEALCLLFSISPNDRTENFYEAMDFILMWGRQYNQAWKLQYLTDLNKLPDYEKINHSYYGYRSHGAPVGADGKAVFYHVPDSLKNALNDGERWRWTLQQWLNDKKINRHSKLSIKLKIANFFKSQFSVETIAYNMRSKIQSIKTGPYAIHLLKDDETIAKLATGVQKIKLPDDCNYIGMYKELIGTKYAQQGLGMLAMIYKNRRQYVKAANVLREIIRIVQPNVKKLYIKELNQIAGNWVELLNCKTFPAGVKPEVNLKFRNADEISCKLTKVKIENFIEDIKKNLKDPVKRKEMFKLGYQPQQVGNWLLKKQGERYLGKEVEEWNEVLKPLGKHFDKTIQLKLPVSEAGVYFLEVTAKDGNTSRIIVWLSNTAIIERDANGGKLYIVTDALTGRPLDYCRLKFFGYKSKYIRDEKLRTKAGERYTYTFNEFFTQTDANGTVFVETAKLQKCGQAMIEASVDDNFEVLGFSRFYNRRFYSQKMNKRRKVYAITDRPIYKPGQTVNFNYWLRTVGYGRDNFVGEFAGKKVKLIVRSPRKKLLEKEFRLDNFGAFNSSFKLPDDADLGSYSISLDRLGGYINFRVEEYRKPEYEVKVAMPEKPLMLGNKIPITVKADYLFGAPVVNAKVQYKVYRTSKSKFYMPYYKWDWLYGRNACVFSGCYIYRSWQSRKPTELVASNIGTTDANGELSFTIDTALAKALFDDEDSEYKVTAEVTDSSRYTEVGQGKVIAASKAFRVYCGTDKGFYQTGDVVNFSISAMSSNDKKVAGKYIVDLFKITYDDKKSPVETKLKSWNGDKTSKDAKIKFRLKTTGHYLARTKVTDTQNNSITNDLIIRVVGKGVSSSDKMTDLPLEIITDKKTYKPGDTASIMINSADSDQNVYLFVRPASSGNPKNAKLINLPTGSAIRELNIRPSDMPNVFIEAVAVRNGRMYSVTKQIIVPPEKKILNIELKTAENKYKPGKKCPLKIKITDSNGKPVVGDVVLTVYDKALDILSKGSNVPEINSFFWKWTRNWYMRARSSLNKYFSSAIMKKHELRMRPLGIFGHLPAPMMDSITRTVRRNTKAKGLSFAMEADSAPAAGAAAPGKDSVVVRKNFADSVLWKVALKTDKNGMAELPIPLPDNLTTWKIRAWAMTNRCAVGQGESEVIVSKDYLVRLILPRFMTVGDTATLSAIIMNQGKQSGKAATSIKISGESLKLLNASEQKVELGANSEKRLDWQVQAVDAGKVAITVKSFCGENSDALELQLPIQIKGITKQVATSGYIKARQSASVIIDIPAKREEETTKLTINFSPSIAAAMVDALPYLINTDDKDIFSTINRFVPALIAQNTLKKMGVNLAEIEKSRTNLNPTELGDKHTRSAQWKRLRNNPVFSDKELRKIVAKELINISGMQNSDGGWGWFSGFYERSGVYTTVRTVRALLLVKDVDKKMLSRGVAWLKIWQERRIKLIKEKKYAISNIDALVFDTLVKAGIKSDFMLEKLFTDRSNLSINGLTILATACQRLKNKAKLKMLLKNIEQFIVEDKENQTAYLRIPDNYWWWFWYGRDIDTQAAYLKLLAKVDPRGKRAAWLAKYILINRKHATYWTSVVDTGLCVEALCEFIQNSGESKPDMNVEVLFDGKVLKKVEINADNMFDIDNSIKLSGKKLTSGKHKVEIRRQGKGAVYFNTYVSYFTMEDFIKRAGLDLKIKRQYFKLVPIKAQGQVRGSRGQALMVGVEKYKRVAIDDFAKILSGDLIEIEFTIESKNDYEYIVINDGKPAGFEPVTVLSGYTQNNLGAFVEMRNTLVRFYVHRLARGKHSMSYRMRAVTPGKFTALPVIATGAYAPELRCNSNEFSVNIR